jgi:hypothetical protein
VSIKKKCVDCITVFFIDTFVSLAIPSLQLRLTTSLFSNLDSKLKTNSQYLSIDQCRVLIKYCISQFNNYLCGDCYKVTVPVLLRLLVTTVILFIKLLLRYRFG